MSFTFVLYNTKITSPGWGSLLCLYQQGYFINLLSAASTSISSFQNLAFMLFRSSSLGLTLRSSSVCAGASFDVLPSRSWLGVMNLMVCWSIYPWMGLLFSISEHCEKMFQYSLIVSTGLLCSVLKIVCIITLRDLIDLSAGSLHCDPGGMKVQSMLYFLSRFASKSDSSSVTSCSVSPSGFSASSTFAPAMKVDIGSLRT